jgi:hypothetical protein
MKAQRKNLGEKLMKIFNRWIQAVPVIAGLLVLFLSGTALAANEGQGSGDGSVLAANNGNGKALGKQKKSDGSSDGSGSVQIAQAESESDGSGEEVDSDGVETSSVPGNGKGPKKASLKNAVNGNASDGVKGRIVTNKDIVYTGEPLEIGLHFAQGADLIHSGEADAYLVIFAPMTMAPEEPAPEEEPGVEGEGGTGGESETPPETQPLEVEEPGDTAGALADAIVVPVSDEASTEITKLFEIPEVDLAGVAAGTYQLGLVLTIPGGDPLVINDWYNGFLGLVDIVGLTITAEAVAGDQDGDGMLDCEPEVDGLTCEETDDGTGTGDGDGTDDGTGSGDDPVPPADPV